MTLLRSIASEAAADTDRPVGIREGAILFALLALFQTALVVFRMEFAAALFILALFAFTMVLRDTAAWVIAVVVSYLPVFWETTDAFTAVEIAQSILLYGGLLWWFFNRVVIQGKLIHWSPGTVLAAASFMYVLLLVPVSIANEADGLFIVREAAVLGSILLCVPIRHAFTSPVKQRMLVVAFFAAVMPIAVKNIVQYQERVITAVAYWEIGASRQTESYYLFFVAAMILFALLITERRLWLRGIFVAGLVISLAAATLSFYRSIWVTILLGYILFGVVLGGWYWRKLALYAMMTMAAGALAVLLLLGGLSSTSVVGLSIADRFVSVGGYGTDPSLINRNIETAAAVEQTGTHLLIGHGLSSHVVFRNYITGATVRTTWDHNGYAWLLFHFGIIGGLLSVAPYLWFMVRAWWMERRVRALPHIHLSEARRWRALIAACGVILAGLLFVSLTSNQFLVRDATMATSIIWGMLDLWDSQLREPKRITMVSSTA
jgi:hypothetical protein